MLQAAPQSSCQLLSQSLPATNPFRAIFDPRVQETAKDEGKNFKKLDYSELFLTAGNPEWFVFQLIRLRFLKTEECGWEAGSHIDKCGSWLHSQDSGGHFPHERWGRVEEGRVRWSMCAGTVLGDGLIPSNYLGEIWARVPESFSLWKEEKLQTKRENCSGSGFFNLGTLDISNWIILCRGWSWACRLFNSIPDLYPPDRSSTPPSVVTTKNIQNPEFDFFLKA